MDKAMTLQQSNGNYDASARLSNRGSCLIELSWWIANIMSSLKHINVTDTYINIYTDSSTLGWDVTDGNNPSLVRRKAD